MKNRDNFSVGMVALLLSFIFSSQAASEQDIPIPQTKIVGGELADEGAWPWMSALVVTSSQVTTSLRVDNSNYATSSFSYGLSGNANGDLVDCGIGDSACANANNKICLIERGQINFSEKVLNCQAGGGLAAVIYNNVTGLISGTLGEGFSGAIPVVAISQSDGELLLTKLGTSATVSVSEPFNVAQDSTCGASFIGNKWLITAAHCVDSVLADQLKVNVGEYDLSNGAADALEIKRIYIHPDFSDITLDNDIAILELHETVNIQGIALANTQTTDTFLQANLTATALGWGGRVGYEPDNGPTSDFPDKLHQVELSLLTNTQCKITLAQSFTDDSETGQTFLPSQMGVSDVNLCATFAGGGKGTCQGDSGGPLMVNTNQGWQLLGIVSAGFGCAAEGYPGIYTRVEKFSQWVEQITDGIAIEQSYRFGFLPVNSNLSVSATVVNNGTQLASLTFAIEGSDNFTVNSDNCLTLAAGASCELTLRYAPNTAFEHNALLTIHRDATLVNQSELSGQALPSSTSIANHLGTNSSQISWFTGGDVAWATNNSDTSIESGSITYQQESAVLASLSSGGEFAFQWAVFSEDENNDRDSDSFAPLSLYVNGQFAAQIKGNIEFTDYNLNLGEGQHRITWVFEKDVRDTNVADKAMLRNIVFTPTVTTPSTEPNNSTSANSNSGGSGGSLMWLIALISLINMYRFSLISYRYN